MSSPSPLEIELRKRLRTSPGRPLPWAEVMHLALYHPTLGYYGSTPRTIGRGGDFFTAVSVGPLYGQLIAQVAQDTWQRLGSPPSFTLIEQGAHDGTLMKDIWAGLQATPLGSVARLCLIEDKPAFRTAQAATLQHVPAERLAWLDSPAELPTTPSLFVCNELLDAFTVNRLRWTGSAWEEAHVHAPAEDTPLEWQWQPIDTANQPLAAELAQLPVDLPPGYTTEVHPAAASWMQTIASAPFTGALLIADYGYEASEYYAPERADGTLRRYYQHKTDGDVLKDLGQSDLTAHINFSRLISIAADHGLTLRKFLPQGRFLTQAAEPWLRSLEGKAPDAATRAQLRQFQTLTHPAHMGAAFRMLLLDKP